MATTISKDGTKIAYDKTGDGPALIIVAGAFQDRMAMSVYAEPLSKRFTVLTMTAVGAEKVAIPSPILSNAKLKISTRSFRKRAAQPSSLVGHPAVY